MNAVELKSKTERPTLRLDARNPDDISRAAAILRNGGTVAFPTETVYGLGANALSPEAVAKIFTAKQRPSWDPLIVHISDRAMLSHVASVGTWGFSPADKSARKEGALAPALVPKGTVEALIAHFWPGPLTLLLPRTAAILDAVTAGRPLVGVRMPNHPVALELIRQAGVPVAAPSANTFGHTSPTTAAHVLADLDGRIDAVLDGGPTQFGLESTVIGFNEDKSHRFRNVIVYRPGAITDSMLSAIPGIWTVESFVVNNSLTEAPEALPSPGAGVRHYAPRANLILVDEGRDKLVRLGHSPENVLVDAVDRAFDGVANIGVMLPDGWNSSCAQLVFHWGSWDNPEILARRLYSGLRELDDRGATIIVCPIPESYGIADAIRDRLSKAAK